MRKIDFNTLPRLVRLWGLALAGIAGMVLLARLFPVAHYFLFVHHLFYIVAVMLLLNPLSETFWPSPELKKKKTDSAATLRQSPRAGRGTQTTGKAETPISVSSAC